MFPWALPNKTLQPAYEVTDTKLSRKAAPKHVIQLCFYAELLETASNTVEQMGLINTLCRGYYEGKPVNEK